ncbi:hypothetical protein, partial [Enterococcus faecalis]|uniref:hypothetical protein n=1 Tax=Enterococcus faecalis TaxID=1351 RepID=UPI001C9E8009
GYNNHILLKLLSFKMIHRHSSCYLFYYSTLFDSRFKTLQQNPLFYAFSGKNHYDIGLLWGLAVNIVFCILAFASITFVMPRKNN